MNGTRFLALTLALLCNGAIAATTTEIELAFAKAKKNGATAVYHDRCGGDGTSSGGIVFDDNSVMGLVKAMGALATHAAIKDQDGGRCSAGLQPGQERYYEIYPDGSVKMK